MELLGQNKIDRHQRQLVILSQDSFYRELTPEQKAKALKGQFNFDHPGTLMLLKKLEYTNVFMEWGRGLTAHKVTMHIRRTNGVLSVFNFGSILTNI